MQWEAREDAADPREARISNKRKWRDGKKQGDFSTSLDLGMEEETWADEGLTDYVGLTQRHDAQKLIN